MTCETCVKYNGYAECVAPEAHGADRVYGPSLFESGKWTIQKQGPELHNIPMRGASPEEIDRASELRSIDAMISADTALDEAALTPGPALDSELETDGFRIVERTYDCGPHGAIDTVRLERRGDAGSRDHIVFPPGYVVSQVEWHSDIDNGMWQSVTLERRS